ncbi:HNH endonuclease family protein [Sphingomicrobium arenosum]|uniref:HNH endonuclease family protein n=1 Tax=Sphingomicrobium arenosum TaxID=2233861 RepID=UPI0022404D41|nr:DUF262 domain-containing protein [Sphingomicrobium arenosum]
MKIELKEITVRELAEGYRDNQELGVVAFGGKLDVRPPYQREFVYKDAQRDAVIDTLSQGYPLNVMYWSVRDDDKGYEIIDGQQRTISICQFIEGDFAVQIGGTEQLRYFHNLQEDEKQQILDYSLMVYLCSGTHSEKLEWFKTINISGEELTAQELRNAVYSGPWVSSAKPYFSKSLCPAHSMGGDYLSGSAIRQDYLETTLKWMTEGKIDEYMGKHQHDPNANALRLYFESVISWVKATFPHYRSVMKGVPWGFLFNEFKDAALDSDGLEAHVSKLMADDDVQNKKGIYSYVLDGKEKHLNLRAFTPAMRRAAYERQKGVCVECGKKFEFEQMEADHIDPWHSGGRTVPENCQMLCQEDNRRKGGR